jgi:Transmembrane amino acid transporter protein
MYPATSIFIAVGQLAIAILVLFSYPLQVHPCRNCLDKVFHFGQSLNAVKQTVDDDEDEEDDDDDGHGHSEMSKLKHLLLTMAIVVSGFIIAYMMDDLQIGSYFLLGDFIPDVNLGSSFVICGGNWVNGDIVHSTWPAFLGGMWTNNNARKDDRPFDIVNTERCNSFQEIELGCFWTDGIWDLCLCFLVSAMAEKKENIYSRGVC